MSKMVLVEAKNSWAVQTTELLLMKDGTVSKDCFILLVHRECESIGIRAETVEEVSYADFMTDFVDPERFLADGAVSDSLKRSLSKEDRSYLREKIRLSRKTPDGPAEVRASEITKPQISAGTEDVRIKLTGGLLHLGFKKSEVGSFVDGLGSRLKTEKVEDLLRLGIQELAA